MSPGVAQFCQGFTGQNTPISQLSFNEFACLNFDQVNSTFYLTLYTCTKIKSDLTFMCLYC